MAGIVDVDFMNKCLDAWLGPNKAAHMPDEYRLRLWNKDPRFGGTELTADGGYTPLVVSGVDWLAADAGAIEPIDAFQLADPTDEWSDVARFITLNDVGTDVICFVGRLLTVLDVADAGDGPRFKPSIFFADQAAPAA